MTNEINKQIVELCKKEWPRLNDAYEIRLLLKSKSHTCPTWIQVEPDKAEWQSLCQIDETLALSHFMRWLEGKLVEADDRIEIISGHYNYCVRLMDHETGVLEWTFNTRELREPIDVLFEVAEKVL